MLNYLFEVSICLGAFYLLYLCLLSRETFFGTNRWYLLGTLVLSIVLPLYIPFAQWWVPAQETMLHYTIEPVVVGLQEVNTALAYESGMPVWIIIGLCIYWTGVLILMWRLVSSFVSIRRMYQSGMRAVREGNVIVSTPGIALPFSFMRWIFLPAEHRFTEAELSGIIAHESAHVRSWHTIDILCMEIACVFLWPSPLIYCYRKSLRRVHEYLADAAVLKHTPIHQYGRLLLSQSLPQLQLALTHQFFHSQLKHRILMMKKDKSRKVQLLKYAALLPVVVAVFVLFAFRQSDHTPTSHAHRIMTSDSIPDASEIFKVVEVMPRFPGCEDSGLQSEALDKCAQQKMLEFIYQAVKYPAAARQAGIQGRAVAQFVVRKNGEITDATIVRSLGHGTDEEVLRVINSMPAWRPGYQRGEAVHVQYTLPVQFKLQQDEKPQSVEFMPRFPGCEGKGLAIDELYRCSYEQLGAFVQTHLRYPEEAKQAGVEGQTIVKITIRADGTVSDPQIVKSIGYGTDAEVLNVISAMQSMPERWRPGYHKGKPVDAPLTIPIAFKLPQTETQPPKTTTEVPDVHVTARPLQETQPPKTSAHTLELEQFDVFPVPSSSRITYRIRGLTGKATVSLLSMKGEAVFSREIPGDMQGDIDTKSFPQGSYTLVVQRGDQMISKQVLIQ